MKKFSFSLLAFLVITSCQKNQSSTEITADDAVQLTQRNCGAEDVLQAHLEADPSLRARLSQVEAFTQRAIALGEANKMAGRTITIPVIVHVLYNTAAQNISDAQIQSQVDVLNEDFSLRNADNRLVPSLFSSLKADVGVKFTLDRVIRKPSSKAVWPLNDGMKYTGRGGSDAIEPSKYLNVWVCNLSQGYLGYAQYPGYSPATDGVVVTYDAFGRTGTLSAPYNKGRTATHEVGHWLNLRHIWGSSTCGDDLVDDTPKHTSANFGCPAYPKYNSCDGAVEMTMNYMDYTDDACMYMFSNGQKSRMLAVFASGGPRSSFAQ